MHGSDARRHPAWFAAVMGTGVLALALLSWRTAWGIAAESAAGRTIGSLAWVALVVATVLAVLLLPRYAARLSPAQRPASRAELADPSAGALLGTVPGGILVLAVAWPQVGSSALAGVALPGAWVVGAALAVVGAVLAVAVGLAWASAIASSTEPALEKVNGSWFIPPVVTIIVPLALAAPMGNLPAAAASTLWLTGLWFWGAGLLLFLAVLALVVARMAIAGPQPAALAPSQWIPLAPAGIGGAALLRLTGAAADAGIVGADWVPPAALAAAVLAGFGLWWALFAGLALIRHRRAGTMVFHPGWWGFTFPLGAMAVSLALQSVAWDSVVAALLATLLLLGLLVAWIAAARGSLRAAATGGAGPGAASPSGPRAP